MNQSRHTIVRLWEIRGRREIERQHLVDRQGGKHVLRVLVEVEGGCVGDLGGCVPVSRLFCLPVSGGLVRRGRHQHRWVCALGAGVLHVLVWCEGVVGLWTAKDMLELY